MATMDTCVSCGKLREIRSLGKCSPCYYAGYREANRERLRAYHRNWYLDNKPKVQAYQRRYRLRKQAEARARANGLLK